MSNKANTIIEYFGTFKLLDIEEFQFAISIVSQLSVVCDAEAKEIGTDDIISQQFSSNKFGLILTKFFGDLLHKVNCSIYPGGKC